MWMYNYTEFIVSMLESTMILWTCHHIISEQVYSYKHVYILLLQLSADMVTRFNDVEFHQHL